MKRAFPLVFVLTAGVVTAGQAEPPTRPGISERSAVQIALQERRGSRRPRVGLSLPRLAKNTPVVVVGEVTSQPKGIIDEDKMQVAVGPARTDVTLHLSGAKMYNLYGAAIDEDALADKMWVRAEGTVMDDPRRIKVTRLQVVGKDTPTLKQSAFYRPGFEHGYMIAVAGSREIFPASRGPVFTPGPLTLVGRVSDDTGPLETTRNIQVDAAGNTWTVSVPKDTPIYDLKGEKVSVHELNDGQWVRIHGWQTDDLRVRAARLQSIGVEEAYRASAYFRAAEPIGYVERAPGTGIQFSPLQLTGEITAVDRDAGVVTVRDQQGKSRTFFLETVTIYSGNRIQDTSTLKTGQRVTIHGSEISF